MIAYAIELRVFDAIELRVFDARYAIVCALRARLSRNKAIQRAVLHKVKTLRQLLIIDC